MSKTITDVANFTNLLTLNRVIEAQKKSDSFTSDINFVYSGIRALILKGAVGENLSDDELVLLKTKTNNLIADIEAILS